MNFNHKYTDDVIKLYGTADYYAMNEWVYHPIDGELRRGFLCKARISSGTLGIVHYSEDLNIQEEVSKTKHTILINDDQMILFISGVRIASTDKSRNQWR